MDIERTPVAATLVEMRMPNSREHGEAVDASSSLAGSTTMHTFCMEKKIITQVGVADLARALGGRRTGAARVPLGWRIFDTSNVDPILARMKVSRWFKFRVRCRLVLERLRDAIKIKLSIGP